MIRIFYEELCIGVYIFLEFVIEYLFFYVYVMKMFLFLYVEIKRIDVGMHLYYGFFILVV